MIDFYQDNQRGHQHGLKKVEELPGLPVQDSEAQDFQEVETEVSLLLEDHHTEKSPTLQEELKLNKFMKHLTGDLKFTDQFLAAQVLEDKELSKALAEATMEIGEIKDKIGELLVNR